MNFRGRRDIPSRGKKFLGIPGMSVALALF